MGEGQAEAWRQRTRRSGEGASAWPNIDKPIEAIGCHKLLSINPW